MNCLQLAEHQQEKAWNLIRETGIRTIWESIGAEVRLVGSLKTGLLMKHRDIDFHIYTAELNIADSFRAAARIAQLPSVLRMEYRNGIFTDEHCIEWHAWLSDPDGEEWQLDMIQILRNSEYDGYFERVADRIISVLTPETRNAILQLKYDTPESEHIMGIEYYQAVIRDGVREWADFVRWRREHPVSGIVEWCP